MSAAELPSRHCDHEDTAWQLQAACRNADTGIFYQVGKQGPHDRDALHAPAKAICVRCPVQSTCLEYALAHREEHGVWGGLDEDERRRLRRRRLRAERAS